MPIAGIGASPQTVAMRQACHQVRHGRIGDTGCHIDGRRQACLFGGDTTHLAIGIAGIVDDAARWIGDLGDGPAASYV